MLAKHLFLGLAILFTLPYIVLNWCKQISLKTSTLAVAHLAVSPNSRYLAIVHSDNIVKFYSAENYAKLIEYNPGFAINVIRFSNDGNYFAIGGASANIVVLNAYEPFTVNKTFAHGLGDTIYGLDFSNDSTKFVACGVLASAAVGNVWLYTVAATGTTWVNMTAAPVSPTPTPATSSKLPNDCRISPVDGKISVSMLATIFIYADTLPTTPLYSYNPTNTNHSKFVFDPLSTSILYIDRNGNQFYQMPIATGVRTLLSVPTDILYATDITYNGKYIAVGGKKKILFIYGANRAVEARWDTKDEMRAIVFSRNPINQKLFVGDISGQVLVLSFNCSRLTCPSQYYMDPTGCKFCADVLPKCINCVNQTVCDKCLDGYFLGTDNQCKVCPIFGCLTCITSTSCFECHSGFYIATVSGVNTCKRCSESATAGMDGCAVCSSESVCIGCNNDHYLDTGLCKLCSNISNCLKCSNSTVCTECIVGFYKNGNTCSPCSSNCLACEGSNTNCTQCPRGWFVNMPTSYTCTRCNASRAGCLACNSSNFCFECDNGMYEKNDGTCAFCIFPCVNCEDDTVCYGCAAGFFLSGTSCLSCTNNCASCNSTAYCVSCLAGFHLASGNVCKFCNQTYAYCEYCTDTTCQICQPGFALNGASCQKCSASMFKCEKCSSTSVCLSCLEGFYLVTPTPAVANDSCKSCEIGCQTCTDSVGCRKCYPQYYLHTNTSCVTCPNNCLSCSSDTVCIVCDQGYYLDGSVCKLCRVNLTNCLQCSSGTVCVDCEIGFYLDSTDTKCKKCLGNCVSCDSSKCMSCQIGYYLTTDTNPVCSACSQTCTQCTSATSCTSCKVGFYLSSSTCKNCSLNKNCQTCSSTTCYSCEYGYFLQLIPTTTNYKCTRCLSQVQGCTHCNATNYCISCVAGYYRSSSTNLCVSCTAINGCEKCTDGTTCVLCGPGFFLNASKCQECKIGCSTCDDTGACSSCSPGFYLSGTNCLTCKTSLQGCSLCPTSSSCSQCMNGYFLQSNQCKLCRETLVGCFYCNSSSICTSCQPGFYLDTANNNCSTCNKQMSGCEICNSSSVCLDCENGYYLAPAGAGCLFCSTNLPGCISCTDMSTCKACKSGFYLKTDNKCYTCFSANSGCQTCAPTVSGGITCSQCSSGFYLNPTTSLCTPCQNIGCSICDQTTPSICLTCGTGYFKSGSSCSRCNSLIQGCNQCLSSSQCVTCDVGYYLDTTGKCMLCQNVLNGCGKCQKTAGNLLQCVDCKSSYILNVVNKTCDSCFSVLQGCIYCVNSSECISCSNGYFKDSLTGLCRSCTQQPGCMLCSNQTYCQYCGPSYYNDHSINKCIKCSQTLEFCLACLEATRCLSCQSGYIVTEKFLCEQVTVTAKDRIEGVKLVTEFVDKETLSHTLMVKNDQYSNIGYDLKGACTLYLTDYNQLSATKKIAQVQLNVKDVLWISPSKIKFLTDNPTSLKANEMSVFRRLQENEDSMKIVSNQNQSPRLLQESGSNLGNFKVSLQMSQQAVNNILPNFYQTGDMVLDYSLDEPQFYTSYLKYESNTTAKYYSFFGYIVTGLLLLNFIYKTYKLSSLQNSHHFTGQILSHIFALKSISLFHYPITLEFYYFCYGFMLVDFPWLNQEIGSLLGDQADYVPKSLAMYFYNLNIASSYLLALGVFVLLWAVRFLINAKKELSRSKYTSLVYSVFMFGLTFAGCLSVQGAKFNPIHQVTLNSVFYLIGIIVYLAIFIQVLYSIHLDRQNFYKIRIFIKATLLSLGHLNPIIVVSMAVILDILLAVLQFVIIESTVAWGKIWLVNNLMLDLTLGILFLLPNSALSLYGSIVLVGIVTFMEILLTLKLMAYCEELVKIEQAKKQSEEYKKSSRMNETEQNIFNNQKDINYLSLQNTSSIDDGTFVLNPKQNSRQSNRQNQNSEAAQTKYTAFNKTYNRYEDGSSPEIQKEIKKQSLDATKPKRARAVSSKLQPISLLRHDKMSINTSAEFYNDANTEENNQNQQKKTQTHFIQASKNRRRGAQNRNALVE